MALGKLVSSVGKSPLLGLWKTAPKLQTRRLWRGQKSSNVLQRCIRP